MNRSTSASRWLVVMAGTGYQLCLGTVYAWSYFQDPLVQGYGWTNVQVTWAFSLAICFFGVAAACGGTQLPRLGPRRLAILSGLLFGAGYLLAAVALHWKSLPMLYLGYGVVGGSGLGLGYAAPVTTVAKWFPHRKGLATGVVIMGFGLGALLMSKVFAPFLYHVSGGNLVLVFAWLGVGFTVATVALASLLRDPPADFAPATNPVTSDFASQPGSEPTILANLLSFRFVALWTMFFLNSLAGISVISFQSPLFQDLWRNIDAGLSPETLAGYGATLIGASSLCNGAGRMFWGGLSDRVGRAWTFRFMLASQIAVFAILPLVGNPWFFGAMICYILLCYGGGSGTIPSFVHDLFGAPRMAVLYGVVLTATSAAGIAGPQIVAYFKDHYAEHVAGYAFPVNAGVLAVGLLCASLLNDRPRARAGAQPSLPGDIPPQCIRPDTAE